MILGHTNDQLCSPVQQDLYTAATLDRAPCISPVPQNMHASTAFRERGTSSSGAADSCSCAGRTSQLLSAHEQRAFHPVMAWTQ